MSDDLREAALDYHHFPKPGKLGIHPTKPLANQHDLALAYSPGVAIPCEEIAKNPADSYIYTSRANLVAVITNGTAVLGLGAIGALASKPVMEGKACLFKSFAGIDVFDIEIDELDVDKFVDTVARLEPTFGAINLEDIKAPECFEIESRLKERMGIPVFHDDQHGTAIVTLAPLINALRLVGKEPGDLKVVFNGVGAAGVAVSKIFMDYGITNLIGCDRSGAIYSGRSGHMNFMKQWYADHTNPHNERGSLGEVIEGADVFIGLSAPGVLTVPMLKKMNRDAIVFAMANPTPEIMPEEAAPHVRIMATGRSDYPNQVNNVLAFPGVFRGALDVRATTINDEMKRAAAYAIAGVIPADELHDDYIIPSVFNKAVVDAVAKAVAKAARASGVARRETKG
jgi:malate dehydrogenase (oxaloacetate-decarboxylating)